MWYRNGQSTWHSRQVIRPTWCTTINLIFYSEFAIHNILQYYFGTGQDDKKPGPIPGDTVIEASTSVPNWPNFRLQNSKGAGKKYVRPSKLAAEFLLNICQKGPKKGRKLFLSPFFWDVKKRKDHVKIYNSLCVLYHIALNIYLSLCHSSPKYCLNCCKKNIDQQWSYSQRVDTADFFFLRPNFCDDLAELFCQELATLDSNKDHLFFFRAWGSGVANIWKCIQFYPANTIESGWVYRVNIEICRHRILQPGVVRAWQPIGFSHRPTEECSQRQPQHPQDAPIHSTREAKQGESLKCLFFCRSFENFTRFHTQNVHKESFWYNY